MSGYDEGPVYYREIQKNAYLKRIPNDSNVSKLRPLGHKKPPLKPMWTLFCVHNGRTPFLEQYPEQDSPNTLAHKPTWRACLKATRHVTASVKPHLGDEYDFLVDTDHGPVRMLAPDWDSMQDWVTILRTKLHELRILSRGENVYGAPPVAPTPRAAARDPTSPLPPTPPVPPDRVPGIDLTPITRAIETAVTSRNNTTSTSSSTNTTTTQASNINTTQTNINTTQTNINTTQTNINTTQTSINTTQTNINTTQTNINTTQTNINTTQANTTQTNTTQNPILPISNNLTFSNVTSLATSLTSNDVDISNWEPYSLPSTSRETEPKSIKVCGQNICLDNSIFKRDVTDSDEEFFNEVDQIHNEAEQLEGEVEYKQRVVVNNEENNDSEESVPLRSNVTVIQVSNKAPHTAIPVMGPQTDVFDFEFKQKLNMSEQNKQNSNFVNIVNTETNEMVDKTAYEHISLTTTVSLTGDRSVNIGSDGSVNVTADRAVNLGSDRSVNMTADRTINLGSDRSVNVTAGAPVSLTAAVNHEGVYERLCMASTSNNSASPLPVRRIKKIDKIRKSSLPNLEIESNYECLFPTGNTVNISNGNIQNHTIIHNGRNSSQVGSTVLNSYNNGNTEVQATRNLDNSIRSNVERSRSQNAYDIAPRRRESRMQNNSPKRDIKNEKPELQQKPIWRRGLTELSLLSRLRGMGRESKRQESPIRNEQEDRGVTTPVKVVHRSRPAARDCSRRRSNSLTNSQSPSIPMNPNLQPLRARQVAALREEQRRGACIATTVPLRDAPLLCEYEKQLWVARWGVSGARCGGRGGDRLAAAAGARPSSLAHARLLLKTCASPFVDLLFHRVPLGKIYVVYKKDRESLGIKLDNECTIISIPVQSPVYRVGLPTHGKWALTEINNRPLSAGKGCEEEMNRLACHGTEVSILIQPAPLVKKMRAAIKASKPLLGLR